jgi:hypothetical protein
VFDILSNFSEFDDTRLAEYLAEVRTAFDALAELEAPTDAQLDEAETLADHIDALVATQEARATADAARTDRAAALRERFSEAPEEPAEEEAEEEAPVVESPATEEQAAEEEAVAASTAPARAGVRTLARRVERPPVPVSNPSPITITAAADVPEFATGSRLDDMVMTGQTVINRLRGLPEPHGDGESEDLRYFGAASFRLDFPEDLQINHRTSDDMEVLYNAIDEARLPGGSLVAAGGWCAPSETLYDLCGGETTEGLVSVPEVQVNRGGIKYTSGPDFGAIYSAVGFCQTEAQAIAGTAKTCFEVPCPTFTEVRLDVCGLCIKIPILTSVGYPELIQRWMSGATIAHQHKMNAKVIAAMVTAAGASKTITPLGTTAGDFASGLGLIADGIRSKYRLSMTHSMEVVLPFWVKGALANDLSLRNGCCGQGDVNALFSEHNLNPQFVYDWQDTPFPAGTAPAIAYPTTAQALIYPAGTFIKGVSDVISLSAVYDAASLALNTYTGLFFEEGVLVAKMCYEAQLVTVPICNAGRTGAANLTCA